MGKLALSKRIFVSLNSNYVAKSFAWGMFSKILDAGIKVFTVPLLLHHFGKASFGLMALAFSINAYLQLLDMGINTGAVKFFSQWIREGKLHIIDSVARTSMTFYGIIGILNGLILFLIALFGIHLFDVDNAQGIVLARMFYIMALFAIFNWATSVFNQLLVANEKISFVQQINIFRTVLSFVIVLLTLYFKLSLTTYFLSFTIINSCMFVPFFIVAKKDGLIKGFSPAFDWKNFNIIFRYSLAILSMAVFQMTAAKSRPIILNIFSGRGIEVVADFRVLETITIFVISLGGMFSSIFLPKTSKLISDGNKGEIENFAYETTLYTSIICVILCMPFVLCAREIIIIYVGEQFSYLSKWLVVWMFTILAFLHSTPVNSLILAKGRTKILVYCTAFSCIISIIVNAVLSPKIGAGSAVIGHSVYILIQMSFYYFYFNKKVLELNSLRIFKAFLIPASIGFLSVVIIYFLRINLTSLLLTCVVKSLLFLILFMFLLFALQVLKLKSLKEKLFR
jgi:O-antigen/teichoic acid export membrane protein